jgi:hypothetical protein
MVLPGVTYAPSPLHGLIIILIEKICRGDFQLKRVNFGVSRLAIHEIIAIYCRAGLGQVQLANKYRGSIPAEVASSDEQACRPR